VRYFWPGRCAWIPSGETRIGEALIEPPFTTVEIEKRRTDAFGVAETKNLDRLVLIKTGSDGCPLKHALKSDALMASPQHLGCRCGNTFSLFRGLAGKNKSGTHAPGFIANPLQPTADIPDLRRVVDQDWRVAWPGTLHNAPRDHQGDHAPAPARWLEYNGVEISGMDPANALMLDQRCPLGALLRF
jgi:hypothetical protein